jgi:hypothetical protein
MPSTDRDSAVAGAVAEDETFEAAGASEASGERRELRDMDSSVYPSEAAVGALSSVSWRDGAVRAARMNEREVSNRYAGRPIDLERSTRFSASATILTRFDLESSRERSVGVAGAAAS